MVNLSSNRAFGRRPRNFTSTPACKWARAIQRRRHRQRRTCQPTNDRIVSEPIALSHEVSAHLSKPVSPLAIVSVGFCARRESASGHGRRWCRWLWMRCNVERAFPACADTLFRLVARSAGVYSISMPSWSCVVVRGTSARVISWDTYKVIVI